MPYDPDFEQDDGNRSTRSWTSTADTLAGACKMSEHDELAETAWMTYDQAIAIHAGNLRRSAGTDGIA